LRILRRVQGITYWVLNDPREIRRFINSNVKGEWERDNKEDGVDSDTDDWLLSLPKRDWRMRILETTKVRLDPSMMARESFTRRLDERSNEMRRSISEYQIVIWPIVIRAEDNMLKDGHCRFTTMQKMQIGKVMAYVGAVQKTR